MKVPGQFHKPNTRTQASRPDLELADTLYGDRPLQRTTRLWNRFRTRTIPHILAKDVLALSLFLWRLARKLEIKNIFFISRHRKHLSVLVFQCSLFLR